MSQAGISDGWDEMFAGGHFLLTNLWLHYSANEVITLSPLNPHKSSSDQSLGSPQSMNSTKPISINSFTGSIIK
jgi:hypothetical protein